MKIRSGFVSNSSSSSFIMYGAIMKENQLSKFIKEDDDDDFIDRVYNWCNENDLDCETYNEDDNSFIIGKEIQSTYNNSVEEIKELSIKEKVDIGQKLNKLGIDDKKIKFYIGGLSQ